MYIVSKCKILIKTVAIVILPVLLFVNKVSGQEWKQESINMLDRHHDVMKVSGGWAALSVGSGAIGLLTTDDKRWKGYHATNLFFGAFNSVVVLSFTSDLRKAKKADWNYREALKNHRKIEHLYVFNNGFNFAFIFGGLFLREKSKSMSSIDNQFIYKGIGEALVTQGIFFLIMDTTMYFVQKKYIDTKLSKLIPDEIAVMGSEIGFRWNLN